MEIDSVPSIFIGGGIFFVVLLIAGHFTPGYSHTQHSISELGISGSVYGWLVRWAGFVPLGLSFILFAFQSSHLFSNTGPFVLIILTGLATLAAGMFPTDPENRRDTVTGKIHAGAVIVLMVVLNTAPFIFSIPAIYRNPPAGWFFIFSSLLGILMLTLLLPTYDGILPRLKTLFPNHPRKFDKNPQPMPGMEQRILMSLHYIWWFVFSLVLTDDYTLLVS